MVNDRQPCLSTSARAIEADVGMARISDADRALSCSHRRHGRHPSRFRWISQAHQGCAGKWCELLVRPPPDSTRRPRNSGAGRRLLDPALRTCSRNGRPARRLTTRPDAKRSGAYVMPRTLSAARPEGSGKAYLSRQVSSKWIGSTPGVAFTYGQATVAP